VALLIRRVTSHGAADAPDRSQRESRCWLRYGKKRSGNGRSGGDLLGNEVREHYSQGILAVKRTDRLIARFQLHQVTGLDWAGYASQAR